MSTKARWLWILAAFAAGCSSVKTEHPVSADAEALDKERLEGVWLVEDEIVHLRFGDDNVGRLAAIDWDGGEFRIRRCEFIVARAGEGRYVSLREEGGEEPYDLLAYDFAENGDVVVHGEATDAFARAVGEGRLRGEVRRKEEDTEVLVASPSDSLLSFLASAPPGDLFRGTTFVLRRLPVPAPEE